MSDKHMTKFKAVIFDMDGLMFDSERLAREAWRVVSARHGIEISDAQIDRTRGMTCSEVRDSMQIYFERNGSTADARALHRERNDAMHERVEREGIPVKSGLYELIEHCVERGVAVAVATAASPFRLELFLRKSKLEGVFNAIVHGGDVKNGKPHPEIFLTAAERLGLAPRECLALEDSPNGVKSAAAAGMPVIMIPDSIEPTDEISSIAYAALPSLSDVIGLI
jgi:HAD superfamily hydrolase (TIGR01509 family)